MIECGLFPSLCYVVFMGVSFHASLYRVCAQVLCQWKLPCSVSLCLSQGISLSPGTLALLSVMLSDILVYLSGYYYLKQSSFVLLRTKIRLFAMSVGLRIHSSKTPPSVQPKFGFFISCCIYRYVYTHIYNENIHTGPLAFFFFLVKRMDTLWYPAKADLYKIMRLITQSAPLRSGSPSFTGECGDL